LHVRIVWHSRPLFAGPAIVCATEGAAGKATIEANPIDMRTR